MKNNTSIAFLLFAWLFLAQACSKDSLIKKDGKGLTNVANSIIADQKNCNDQLPPIVMVHGMLASGDTYSLQAMRFHSNGYCPNRLFTFDWNTVAGFGGATPETEAALNSFIDEVLLSTGAQKVDLVGHSAGSSLCYGYLAKPENAAKVAHYAHLAGNPQNQPAGETGNIPTLNVYSTSDYAVIGGDIPNAQNLKLTNQEDHYQVATSAATFSALYAFFNNNQAPATTQVISTQSRPIVIAGKAVSLGENLPNTTASIGVFELNPLTGERLQAEPNATITVNEKGYFQPFTAQSNTPYELTVTTPNNRTVVYYIQGFERSNYWLYLRNLPAPGSLAGTLLGGLPKDDNQTVLAVFTANQAVVNGRDNLTIDANDCATTQLASAEQTNIALFCYDDNNNQQTDGGSVNFLFQQFPFLNATDIYLATNPRRSVLIEFNSKKMYVPTLKSESEGIAVAVFN